MGTANSRCKMPEGLTAAQGPGSPPSADLGVVDKWLCEAGDLEGSSGVNWRTDWKLGGQEEACVGAPGWERRIQRKAPQTG